MFVFLKKEICRFPVHTKNLSAADERHIYLVLSTKQEQQGDFVTVSAVDDRLPKLEGASNGTQLHTRHTIAMPVACLDHHASLSTDSLKAYYAIFYHQSLHFISSDLRQIPEI